MYSTTFFNKFYNYISLILVSLLLTSCGIFSGSSGGKYYKNDGPHARVPSNLDKIPNATPRREPINLRLTKPYKVLGQTFVPKTRLTAYKSIGIASWYGKKYHGSKTASGEIYNMYAMTAAHPILPIPSYIRVTNLTNNRTVIVRVNDRGPFLRGREVDLSYVAAYKLGIIQTGSAKVQVEQIIP